MSDATAARRLIGYLHHWFGELQQNRLAAGYAVLAALPFLVGFFEIVGISGWIRALMALTALTFLPGAAILTLLPRLPPLLRIGVAAAISLSIFAIGSAAIIAASWFHPWVLLMLVLVPSSVVLGIRAVADADVQWRPESPRELVAEPDSTYVRLPRRELIFRGLIGCALVVWAVSLTQISVDGMRDLGLLTQIPVSWYAAVLLVALAGAFYAMRPGVRPATMVAFVGALIAMLYSTTPLIYELPHYQWVYKHVGVTLQFMEFGVLIPDSDLYNRWPGMFALGGVFSRFAGYSSPLAFIAWAELYFIAIQTVIVAAIGLREQRKFGIAGLAAIFFVLVNWIGQGYYSPQALTFTLQLAVVAILFSQLSARGNKFGVFLMGVLRRIVRKGQTWTLAVQRTDWPTVTAVLVVVLIDIAMTVSHQLTPYILVMQAGLLWACGLIRPKWIIAIFIAIPVAYLMPMIGWVDDHYGIFSSLDPFNNIKVADTVVLDCTGGCETVSRATFATSLLGWIGGFVAILIVARRRPSFRVPFFAIGMVSPFLMILGQDYGGEAGLRLVMFCAPFAAILIATAITTFGPRLRMISALALTAMLTAGFIVAYFGNEHNYRVTKSELTTMRHYFDNARRGSVLIATVPNIPQLPTSNYASFARNYGGGMVLIWENPKLRRLDKLGAKEVDVLIEDMGSFSRTGYFVTGDEQIRYAESLGLAKPGQLANLERAMLDSGYFDLWYENDGNRIYRLRRTTDSVERARAREEQRSKR